MGYILFQIFLGTTKKTKLLLFWAFFLTVKQKKQKRRSKGKGKNARVDLPADWGQGDNV